MLFATETQKVLCAATQDFANLAIKSTEQVEDTMRRHVEPLMRDVVYPNGDKYEAKFWELAASQTDEYRKNQQELRQLLKRFEKLPVREQQPIVWEREAAPIRETLKRTLPHMLYVAVPEPSNDGWTRTRLVRFGVRSVYIFALDAMLQPDSDAQVGRCQLGKKHVRSDALADLDRCSNFIVKWGGRGRIAEGCSKEHRKELRKHRRRKK